MDEYDAGLLGGDPTWSVEDWHDYLRSELDRAKEFYQEQHDSFADEVKAYWQEVEGFADAINSLERPKA